MARPSKAVDPLKVAQVIGQLGGTDEQLAAALGITRQGLAKRKEKNQSLVDTLKTAKADADARVEKALFQRATGYEHEDVHFSAHEGFVTKTPYTKHYAPDTTACIFWLKNRKPKEWRDRTEIHMEQEIAGVPQDVVEGLRKAFMQTVKS